MKEHFVNYNQALALKELGYNEPCWCYFVNDVFFDSMFPKDYDYFEHMNKKMEYTLAPLKSQVFKWFRDEHHLFANIYEWTTGGFKDNIIPKDWKPECRWKIYKPVGITYSQKDKVLVHVSDNLYRDFYHYEEAESACIDNLISILK